MNLTAIGCAPAPSPASSSPSTVTDSGTSLGTRLASAASIVVVEKTPATKPCVRSRRCAAVCAASGPRSATTGSMKTKASQPPTGIRPGGSACTEPVAIAAPSAAR